MNLMKEYVLLRGWFLYRCVFLLSIFRINIKRSLMWVILIRQSGCSLSYENDICIVKYIYLAPVLWRDTLSSGVWTPILWSFNWIIHHWSCHWICSFRWHLLERGMMGLGQYFSRSCSCYLCPNSKMYAWDGFYGGMVHQRTIDIIGGFLNLLEVLFSFWLNSWWVAPVHLFLCHFQSSHLKPKKWRLFAPRHVFGKSWVLLWFLCKEHRSGSWME